MVMVAITGTDQNMLIDDYYKCILNSSTGHSASGVEWGLRVRDPTQHKKHSTIRLILLRFNQHIRRCRVFLDWEKGDLSFLSLPEIIAFLISKKYLTHLTIMYISMAPVGLLHHSVS